MYFPPEIWDHIFLYADPVTLTNLKTVCQHWNKSIDKILKQNDHWYRKCKTEIPEYFWSTFCKTLNPKKYYTKFHEKHDAEMWMALYKLWITCKNTMNWNTENVCIEPLRRQHHAGQITCVETSGNLIAIGTSEGYIYFYDMCALQKGPVYVADHMEYINTVQFITDETSIICVSRSVNGHISFWDVRLKKLIEKARGDLICTSYSYCYTAAYNRIVIEGSIPRTVYEFDTDNIIAIGADNEEVLFYTQEGHFVHLSLNTPSGNYLNWTSIKPPNIKIRHYYIFKPDAVVCITDNGYLGFLVKGKEWIVHNLFPILHGTPTTVLVYANVLIVGLDCGNVHVYYINDFETINFNTISSKKFTLDYTAVISLNILVQVEAYLIISYIKKVCIVKLN
ncbi:PREDICTED: uncharacterized protein LOC107188316 [Dufourea novaeangliae]|uniref:F-box domain-containing protein n=1 Tax=Dufourea novaeangliae TaxID=178035 RepID=A0A154PGC3_DUFNO|nr:PREDICTED: uncharacterized protein LOC107188316 [Dufourea novaeangliae]KZC10240.1 hypothetical protein WN55_01356 [Dufourea novaeangliae]